MQIAFHKYHALSNDFLVLDRVRPLLTKTKLGDLARQICRRHRGIGADGIIVLSGSTRADCRMDVYNADGSWAEMSGNGLRMVGLHRHLSDRRRRRARIETAVGIRETVVGKRAGGSYTVTAQMGEPIFEASRVPVRTKRRYVINSPLRMEGTEFPVTCLSVGNPHTVMIVSDFDFDWRELGAAIESHRAFPNGTNVEFVRVVNRHRLQVAEWERGAGDTGSSGTGAAAAVCAAVMLGIAERSCTVAFETGTLRIDWSREDNQILLTGPVAYTGNGIFRLSG